MKTFPGKALILLVAVLMIIPLLYLSGCGAARFQIKKVTNINQEGLRFSRPVPYLVITNMGFSVLSNSQSGSSVASSETGAAESEDKQASVQTTEKVIATLIWLPEKKETYAITVEGGLWGSFKGSINLADGWMLTGINQESDAKTAEMLTALGGLATGIKSALSQKEKTSFVQTTTPASKAAFFYMFRIDLTNNTLRLVNSKELEESLSGHPVFKQPTNMEDLDPALENKEAAQPFKGGVQ